MDSGRRRLIDAGLALLTEQADREPSTRELYEAAGVAAPTLYHHFGTKEGLLEAVVTEAFSDYLERKRAVPDSGAPAPGVRLQVMTSAPRGRGAGKPASGLRGSKPLIQMY